ncbi:MAG: hypothetical protein KR126chlam5_00603 [Candidatus Anoxychlamydiales bacterium]|nr:hypothetical protein [Candidatus Anoxychlamydiales bacterium]
MNPFKNPFSPGAGAPPPAQTVKVSFYINHTSECNEPWFKTLNVKLV